MKRYCENNQMRKIKIKNNSFEVLDENNNVVCEYAKGLWTLDRVMLIHEVQRDDIDYTDILVKENE